MQELWRWPATDLARAIRTRRISSREAVQACLDRTRAVNPELNAIVDLMDEEALAAADAADRAVGRGEELGRLAPGCLADVVLLRECPYGRSLGDPAAHVALQSTPADVDTVIVGGRVKKRAGRLTDLDPADAAAATRRVRERVMGAAAR